MSEEQESRSWIGRHPFWTTLIVIILIGWIISTLQGPENNMKISSSNYGNDWPFTISSGTLSCKTIRAGDLEAHEVTLTANGVTYAVNGTARSRDAGVDVLTILKDTSFNSKARWDLVPIIKQGLELCD